MIFWISGSSGFVGRSLCKRLLIEGHRIRGALLAPASSPFQETNFEPVIINPLESQPSLESSLTGADIVIHLAARVHVMQESSNDPLKEFRKVNLDGSAHLARQAAQAGVKRFVFMSSIGVNGNSSGDTPYTEQDTPQPHSPYALSKYEAEQRLKEIGADYGMEVVIVRAPLVYGPYNPGNFLTLLKAVHRMLPLPFGTVNNQRSFLYIDNLVDALCCCAVHPKAANKTYLVSDGEEISTSQLIRDLAANMNKHAYLLPVPASILRQIAKFLGRSSQIEQLVGSLVIDSSKIRRELDWTPPFTIAHGLQQTADWYRNAKQ